MTQHAAFNYLALDYGLKQVAISGLSPDAEPSAARLAELTEYVKKNKIAYIYFEENASQALANTLSKEAGVKTDVLNPLESLTEAQQLSLKRRKIRRQFKMVTLRMPMSRTAP